MKKSTKQASITNTDGIHGWLAFFVFGLGVSTIISIYDVFVLAQYVNDAQAKVKDNYSVVFIVMAALLCMQAMALIQLARRRRIAKLYVITSLILSVVISAIIRSQFQQIYSAYGKVPPAKLTSDVTEQISVAIIWGAYFLLSKRVKLTLTQ